MTTVRNLDQVRSSSRPGRPDRTVGGGSSTPGPAEAPEDTDGPVDSVVLVAACQAGDPSAWRRLIEIYSPVVWTVARSFGLSHADGEDAAQQTWTRVVENVGRLRDPEKLSAWLVTIARREALDVSRRHRRHVPVGDSQIFESTADPADPVEEAALGRLADPRIARAFRELEPEHQALLALLIQEPALSYDEISAALSIPRGSIGPTRNRLLRRLRMAIAPELALAG